MVFEKIIRPNVEQAVNLFKQTNSLFDAFSSKSIVGFNFQKTSACLTASEASPRV
jgi:hypothetical protein